ncbi:MAG: hypothetical protein WBV84_02545 [Nitrososphaeraceae archaeon]
MKSQIFVAVGVAIAASVLVTGLASSIYAMVSYPPSIDAHSVISLFVL